MSYSLRVTDLYCFHMEKFLSAKIQQDSFNMCVDTY